jgi:hypothetical protein
VLYEKSANLFNCIVGLTLALLVCRSEYILTHIFTISLYGMVIPIFSLCRMCSRCFAYVVLTEGGMESIPTEKSMVLYLLDAPYICRFSARRQTKNCDAVSQELPGTGAQMGVSTPLPLELKAPGIHYRIQVKHLLKCWGSGSAGSACFCASRIRIRIH